MGRGWQTFPGKNHIVNSPGFADYMAFVANAQPGLQRERSHRQ